MRSSRKCGLAVFLAGCGWMIWPSTTQAQDAKQPTVKQEAPPWEPETQTVRATAIQFLGELLSVNHPAHGRVAPRCSSCHTPQNLLSVDFFARAGSSHSIGVSVVPADATLRAQLALPAEKGLVVTNVDPNSSASEAGITQHDLLLSLDDKPLASPDDLNNQVDAVGDKPAGLDAIRNGKRIKLLVTPKRVNRVALVDDLSASMAQTRFRIGVELAAAEETLRVQLKLPQGQGVVVTNVIDDLPAAKAGIQKHDILLMLGDKPVASHEEFRDKLQEFGEKPVAIKLIREGKTLSIEVTPQKHQEPAGTVNLVPVHIVEGNWNLDVVRPVLIGGKFKGHGTKVWTPEESTGVATPADPHARLQELIDRVKELQKKLEALSEDLKKQQPATDPAEKK